MGDNRLALALAGLGGGRPALPAPGGGGAADDGSDSGDDRAVDEFAGASRASSPGGGASQHRVERLLAESVFQQLLPLSFDSAMRKIPLPVPPGGEFGPEFDLKKCAQQLARLVGHDLLPAAPEGGKVGALTLEKIKALLVGRSAELPFLFGVLQMTDDDVLDSYRAAYQKNKSVTERVVIMIVKLSPYLFQTQFSIRIVLDYIANYNWEAETAPQQACDNLLASLVLYLVFAYGGNFNVSGADGVLQRVLSAPEKLVEENDKGRLPIRGGLSQFYRQARMMPEKMGVLVMQLIFQFGTTLLTRPGSYKARNRAIRVGIEQRSITDITADDLLLVAGLAFFCRHPANAQSLNDFFRKHNQLHGATFLDKMVLEDDS